MFPGKRLRILAGLLLVLGLVAASGADTQTASATQPQRVQHCVKQAVPVGKVPAPTAAKPICYDNFADAIAFATGGRVQLPRDVPGDQAHQRLRDHLAALGGSESSALRDPGQTLIAIDYNLPNFDASWGSMSSYSNNPSGCYDGTRYEWPYMEAGWEDIVSSADTFQGCGSYTLYEHPGSAAHSSPARAATWVSWTTRHLRRGSALDRNPTRPRTMRGRTLSQQAIEPGSSDAASDGPSALPAPHHIATASQVSPFGNFRVLSRQGLPTARESVCEYTAVE